MLVLSRKRNESILIDDHIKIIVVDVRDDKVRLGIEAPMDMAVHRHEIYEAIQRSAMQEAARKAALQSECDSDSGSGPNNDPQRN